MILRTKLAPEQIDAMPAGHEMDALVAERVMGWKNIRETNRHEGPSLKTWKAFPYMVGRPPGKDFESEFPGYSANVAMAWQVVEKLKEMRGHLEIGNKGDSWWVNLPVNPGEDPCDWRIYGRGGTISEAVCRAALKAALG